jgi:2-polyprenyl-3-methyl-5-hydroxy-6-metoxy-1,4-benzoquinol methylase
MNDGLDDLLEAQLKFYDERAPDFLDPSRPSDRKVRGNPPDELGTSLIDEFAPVGDVLELACGGGACTRDIVRHATSVTAVDGSARMIARNRETVASPKVEYVVADIFDWQPVRAYDAVLFAYWLSHVPPQRFDDFWKLVRACLKPGGRVWFIDEDDRAVFKEDTSFVIDGTPVAKRRLADGREFDIVKVFWKPADLEERLRTSGWQIGVRGVGDSFLVGSGTPS